MPKLLAIIVAMLLLPASLLANPSPPPIFIDEQIPLQPPPGLDARSATLTVMLELSAPTQAPPDGGAKLLAEQAALPGRIAALGVPILFEARSAYRGIAVTATPEQLAQLSTLPGVADIHVIPPKERSLVDAVTQTRASQFWSITRQLSGDVSVTGAGVRIGIIDSGIDYTHATFGGAGTPAAFLANNPAVVEAGSFPTTKVIGGRDFVGDAYNASGPPAAQIPAPDDDPLDCAGDGGGIGAVAGGHGTHVAAIAAGYGVDAGGNAYRGIYSSSIIYDDFLVGPGFAPAASLYAFKIFGCEGTTTFLTAAIDYAIDPNGDGDTSDRLVDVLNISLGSPFGGIDDPDAVAVDRAVEAGVVVVVAAGDGGDVFFSTESPASARLAIAVGASGADGAGLPDFSGRGPQRGRGQIKPDLVAPGQEIRSAAAGSGNLAMTLSGTSVAAPQVAGAAALLRQLRPTWTPQQIKVALVNAASAVRNSAGEAYPPSLAGAGQLDVAKLAVQDLLIYPADDSSTASLGFSIPWVTQPIEMRREVQIDNTGRDARTVRLTSQLAATEPGVTLNFPSGPYTVPAGGSMRIPVTLNIDPQQLDFSPDANTAPTTDRFPRFYLAEHGGNIQVMSTVGARLRTANATQTQPVAFYIDGQILDQRITTARDGRFRAFAPGNYTLTVRRSDASATSTPLATRNITVADGRDYIAVLVCDGARYEIVLVDIIPPPALSSDQVLMRVLNGNVFNTTTPLDVYLDGELILTSLIPGAASDHIAFAPGQHKLSYYRAGSLPATTSPYASVSFSAGSGEILLAVAGRADNTNQRAFNIQNRLQNEVTQVLPFNVFPRAAAQTQSSGAAFTVPSTVASFAFTLGNSGPRNTAASPNGGQTPLVSAFELPAGGDSPSIPALAPSLTAADLRYVGVTNNFALAGNVARTLIFFGTAAYGPWSTPNEVQHRVYIDSTGAGGLPDGVVDYVLVNTSRGAIVAPADPDRAPRADDVFSSVLYAVDASGMPGTATRRATLNVISPPQSGSALDTAPFLSSVMVQVMEARSIGLTDAQPRFRYYVETYARDAGAFTTPIDRVPAGAAWLEYDLRATALAPTNLTLTAPYLQSLPLFVATTGSQVEMSVDQIQLALRSSQRVLLLSHHNTPGAQAEVVTLRSSITSRLSPVFGPNRVALPLMGR
jgi:subtilisin family serine protease